MNELVAIVEDEEDIRALVSAALTRERFRIREHAGGKGFLASLRAERPDLVVLDVMLPDADGFEVCRTMRRDPSVASIPIIMLTARADEADRVLGLELGADDYVVKPFSPKELAARVKAVLRRRSPEPSPARIDAGSGILIDTDTLVVSIDGKALDLTQAEYRVLKLLAERTGWVFSREKILDHLWGDQKTVTDRSVDVHVKHLRDKLGALGKRIVNVRGIGYKLAPPQPPASRERP
jgi:DNA-binding response OmpR family regulator